MSKPGECPATHTGHSFEFSASDAKCRFCGESPKMGDDLVYVLTTVHAIASTPADRYSNDTAWALALMRAAAKAVPAAQRLRQAYAEESEKLQRATDALRKVRLRMHFIGMPNESMWKAGNNSPWIPDWRYEMQLVENVLHGLPITQPEKPTDTLNRIDAESVDGQLTFRQMQQPFLEIKEAFGIEKARDVLFEVGYASLLGVPKAEYRRVYDIAISHLEKLKDES